MNLKIASLMAGLCFMGKIASAEYKLPAENCPYDICGEVQPKPSAAVPAIHQPVPVGQTATSTVIDSNKKVDMKPIEFINGLYSKSAVQEEQPKAILVLAAAISGDPGMERVDTCYSLAAAQFTGGKATLAASARLANDNSMDPVNALFKQTAQFGYSSSVGASLAGAANLSKSNKDMDAISKMYYQTAKGTNGYPALTKVTEVVHFLVSGNTSMESSNRLFSAAGEDAGHKTLFLALAGDSSIKAAFEAYPKKIMAPAKALLILAAAIGGDKDLTDVDAYYDNAGGKQALTKAILTLAAKIHQAGTLNEKQRVQAVTFALMPTNNPSQ